MRKAPPPFGGKRDDSAPRGRFAPGNTAAMRHGGRSKRAAALMLPEQAEARAALAERVAGIVADLGGAEALSTMAIGMVERHARLELVADFLFENLQTLGVLTAKGRSRAALGAWLQVSDRLHRSAVTLGLERRRKRLNVAEQFAAMHAADKAR